MIRRGFTLIELLVVITILAILAGAALPYVQNYVAESRIAKAKTDLEEIARALAVYETREGEYPDTDPPAGANLSDVSQLTGRYLNKAPIDPWGKPYVIDRYAGTVYSSGPDRKDAGASDKYDNISVPYQPPLSIVSVKWVDKNQSGSVDAQNVPDQLKITFSRKIERVAGECTTENLEEWLFIKPTATIAEEAITDNYVQSSNEVGGLNPPGILDDEKTMVLSLKDDFDPAVNPLLLGEAYVVVNEPKGPDTGVGVDGDDLMDKAKNLCLTDQKVVILPQ